MKQKNEPEQTQKKLVYTQYGNIWVAPNDPRPEDVQFFTANIGVTLNYCWSNSINSKKVILVNIQDFEGKVFLEKLSEKWTKFYNKKQYLKKNTGKILALWFYVAVIKAMGEERKELDISELFNHNLLYGAYGNGENVTSADRIYEIMMTSFEIVEKDGDILRVKFIF